MSDTKATSNNLLTNNTSNSNNLLDNRPTQSYERLHKFMPTEESLQKPWFFQTKSFWAKLAIVVLAGVAGGIAAASFVSGGWVIAAAAVAGLIAYKIVNFIEKHPVIFTVVCIGIAVVCLL